MGYTTDFMGGFKLSRKLTDTERNYINTLSGTRRMIRDVNKLMEKYQGKHGNPFPENDTPAAIYGVDGAFFAFEEGQMGQSRDETILDYNQPPGLNIDRTNWDRYYQERERRIENGECQPSLWCQWIVEEVDEETDRLVWDEGEKFYEYIQWLKYLINTFFDKWGVKLNGVVKWRGEDFDDIGTIVVKDSVVDVQDGILTVKEME